MIDTSKEALKAQVTSFLKGQDLAVIATVSKDGLPEAATVGYKIDSNWNIYIFTRKESRKVKNITENPKVAVVIGTARGLNTIQIEGEAQILYKDQPFEQVLPLVAGIESLYYGPLLKMEGSEFAVVKIKINWLRWLDFNELKGKEEFFQVIP